MQPRGWGGAGAAGGRAGTGGHGLSDQQPAAVRRVQDHRSSWRKNYKYAQISHFYKPLVRNIILNYKNGHIELRNQVFGNLIVTLEKVLLA